MRTGRSLTVCRGGSALGVSAPGGLLWGCLLPGGVCSGGVSAQGVSAQWGVCSGGCLFRRGVCSGVSALGYLLWGYLLWGICSGGVSALGGLLWEGLLWGLSALGGVFSWGVFAQGVVSQHALRQIPPYEQNDKQVQKYYLDHHFVAAGKNDKDDGSTTGPMVLLAIQRVNVFVSFFCDVIIVHIFKTARLQ